MKAHQGRIIPAATHLDVPTRDGDLLEVNGEDGEPPYLVRWTEGHLGLLDPRPGSVLPVGSDRRVPVIVDELAGARARRNRAAQLLETPRRTSTP